MVVARTFMSAARALSGVITPIYLALEGFTALRIGALLGVVAVSSALMSALFGSASDRLGRKPFLIGVPFLAAVAGVLFAYTRSTGVLFVAAALGSFGRGAGAGSGSVGPYQPAESALVAEQLAPRWRNAGFGRLSFSSSVGALFGGVLALLGPQAELHGAAATAAFRDPYLAAAGLAALAGLLAVFISEPRPRGGQPPPPPPAGTATAHGAASPVGDPPQRRRKASGGAFHFPRRSRGLLYRLWLTNSLNGFAVGMFAPFISYWLFRRFGVSAGEVGILFAVINAVTAASTLSAARLARRLGLVRTVTAVRMAQAALLVPFVLMPTFEAAGAVYLLRMAVQRIGLPLRQSYVLAMAAPEERAAVSALATVPSQLTMAGSPLFAGYLFDEVSLALPFDIAALFQAANAWLFWAFFHRSPPEEELAEPASEVSPEPE